jgi:hypothetical protein
MGKGTESGSREELDQLSSSSRNGDNDSPPWSYVNTPCNPPSGQYTLLAYRPWHNISRIPARKGNISYVLGLSVSVFSLRPCYIQPRHAQSATSFLAPAIALIRA